MKIASPVDHAARYRAFALWKFLRRPDVSKEAKVKVLIEAMKGPQK